MVKNDFIYTTIGSFREKLDNALKGDNAGPEIRLAVQELLQEINNKYPQTAYQPDLVRANPSDQVMLSNNISDEEDRIPPGVQYMLNNIASLSKK